MKKALTVILISALLLSAVAGAFVRLAKANPLIEETYDSPPIISIRSPENGTQINRILFNLTATKSEDWIDIPISFSYEPGSGISQKLVRIDLYMDGKFYRSVYANSNLSSPFNYSLYLTNITDGSHTISAIAYSTGVVRNWISSTVSEVPMNSSSAMVYFTVVEQSPSPNPKSSPAPEPEAFPISFAVASAIVVVVVLVGIGLLLYGIKKR